MGRLGVVTAQEGRSWRAFAGPAALLVAATIAIGFLRGELRHHSSPAASSGGPSRTQAKANAKQPRVHHRVYVVRAGDTIEAISTRTGVPQTRILTLNPRVS